MVSDKAEDKDDLLQEEEQLVKILLRGKLITPNLRFKQDHYLVNEQVVINKQEHMQGKDKLPREARRG